MRAHSHLVCFNPTWCRDAGSKPKDAFFFLRLVRSFSFLFIPFFFCLLPFIFLLSFISLSSHLFSKVNYLYVNSLHFFYFTFSFFKISYFSECFLCFIFRLIILIIFPNVFFLSHVL